MQRRTILENASSQMTDFTGEEEEEEDNLSGLTDADDSSLYSTDEDFKLAEGYDEDVALSYILDEIPNVRIKLNIESQRDLGIEVGPNVSSEMGWKEIKKEVLEEFLPYGPESDQIKARINSLNRGELILVGFMQHLSEDEDTFIVFADMAAAQKVSHILRKREAFYRTKIIKSFIKYPRPWESLGSEVEVDILVKKPVENVKDVEIQTIYPIKSSNAVFELRLSDDARDGYVELLPGRIKFDNIQRKRIDMAIQSNPMRISLEQQTDPTFPSNAWSQYLYEIKREVPKPTAGSDDEDGAPAPVQPPPPESPESNETPDCIKYLLDTLEFNVIDMYRNDYPYISNKKISKSNVPALKELFSFADFSKTSKRFVASMDWHPTFSGVCVASYTFSTLATTISKNTNSDVVQRTVLEPNPILVWSFDDILNYKLMLKAPREVLVVRYCPYDGNLVIGGTINGQIIVWDLKDRLELIESEEILTTDQIKYRAAMRTFLAWTKEENRNVVVQPSAISSLEYSHKSAITSIQWLNENTSITEGGLLKNNPDKKCKFFVTTSMDGNVCYWDLEMGAGDENAKKTPVRRPRKLPPAFNSVESEYKALDGVLKPTFTVSVRLPITGAVLDHALVKYEPINPPLKRKIFMRVKHSIEKEPQPLCRTNLIVSTYTGDIASIQWHGFEFLQGDSNRDEKINYFCKINGDPVISISKNPFIDNLILSIGSSTLAVWRDDFTTSPIFWRKRSANLSSGIWSKNRPSVFFITRTDGCCEAWDILGE